VTVGIKALSIHAGSPLADTVQLAVLGKTNRRMVGEQLEVVDVKSFLFTLAIGAAFGVAVVGQAQSQVTATCKDGTSFSGTKRSGACRGHGGVQEFTDTTTPATSMPPATTPSTPPTRTTTPPSQVATSKPPSQPVVAPPAGSAGQVWVNTASKVYHCAGTEWYGKTKKGEYMSEAAAKADGARPDHGKVCS